MSKDNLDFPKFEEKSACYFHIDFKRQFNPNEIDNVPINAPRDKRKEIILNRIKNNVHFTKRSLALELDVDEKTILRDLEVLKRENKIIFKGSEKSGVWKIINNFH